MHNGAADSVAPSPRSWGGERVGGRGRTLRGPDRRVFGIDRRLRRHATNAETKLWFGIRDRRLGGFKFVRQEAIGSYVVDFVCREKKLVVEVDGGQHAENMHDRARDCALAADGYHVVRFWDSDVLNNLEGVLFALLEKLEEV